VQNNYIFILIDIKIILSILPGIKIEEDSSAYIEAIQRSIFLFFKNNSILTGKDFKGEEVHYLDYFNPQIKDY